MADINIGELPPGTKRCLVCAEPINIAARKCVHCSSDQVGLLRNVGVSNTVLSLLIALISVLTAGVPVLKDALTPKNSELAFSFQGADDNYINILAANQGTRPGSVRIGKIIRGEQELLLLRIYPNASSQIINPSNSLLLQFSGERAITTQNSSDICHLQFMGNDFKGKETTADVKVDCANVQSFIDTHIKPGF